jgi:predicted ester cyclase
VSTEENKAIVRRAYEEGLSEKNMDVLDEVFDPAYVGHFPGLPPIQSLDEQKTVINSFLEAFPDIVFTVEDQLAEGDKVATRWSAHGTHLGEWRGFPPRARGIPPTGRHVTFSATDIYRIVNGKIVEEWNTLEQFDVLSQLGADPMTEQDEE